MASRAPLGIQRIEALHYYVRDLERTRRFLVDQLDFTELGVSGREVEREGRQRSTAFRAGDALFVLHQPIGEGGRAWRYLRKHPEGVGTVVFEVEEIDRAFRLLDERGGTLITDVQRFSEDGGTLAMFSITTPFGDTTFRFVERRGYGRLFPGFVPTAIAAPAGDNRFGFERIDHLTANFQTMKPALLWMDHVLGFVPLWEIAFHTNDVASDSKQKRTHGSGLKSVVMWDPASGVKFANNEPFRPFFKESQINIFAEDNRGDGIQHSALSVADIVGTVRGLRGRGVERRGYGRLFPGFVPTATAATAPASAPESVAGNRFGFERIDHLTANFQTMKPALLWMDHVLGFVPLWEIAFHTNEVAGASKQKRTHGSGLKSVVMWDPASGVKFANNEPFRPFFKESQINIFAEDNRGDGIQHSALSVADIVGAVRGLRGRGVEFMPTPGDYYDVLPERLRQIGVGTIDESVDLLRELEILVDGTEARRYLLQIFLKEAAGLHHDPAAGPFFFEIIQRKGDRGFGAGNFRALFEAIERQQARAPGQTSGDPTLPRM